MSDLCGDYIFTAKGLVKVPFQYIRVNIRTLENIAKEISFENRKDMIV